MPFFDHNATTPLLPAAREAWLRASDESWQNPASPYGAAARVHRLLQEARERIAGWLSNAGPEEIVFTSGATEANNAVVAWAARQRPAGHRALVSPTEHPSALEPVRAWFGSDAVTLSVDSRGRIDPAEVAPLLEQGAVALTVVMAANNETGVLGPVREVAQLCAERAVPFLCDASQWIGRLPARDLPATAIVVGCAHKFGGPKGVGFLRVPASIKNFHAALGGEQESGRRAGTENYPAIAAMVAALEFAENQSNNERARRAAWRESFLRKISAIIPEIVVNGSGMDRLWNTASLRMPAHENTRWVAKLDKAGCAVSTGSACATGSAAPSHVLAAMGLSGDEARRTIRISAGWETTKDDWRALAAAIVSVWQQLENERESTSGSTVIHV